MSGGGPNSGKTIGFRAVRPDGSTKRFDSRLGAENWAGAGQVKQITRNHNGTRWERPLSKAFRDIPAT